MYQPKILVHLGASEVPEQFQAKSLEWVRKAVEKGYEVAKTGASAEDIVAATVSVLEDCPVSDAGFGSVYNADGGHQMDAGIMTGDKKYGAIVSIHGVQNPIRVARLMVDDPKFSILCGEGAMEFVKKNNIPILPDSEFATEYNRYYQEMFAGHGDPLDLFVTPDTVNNEDGQNIDHDDNPELPEHGTVGCVARDIHGRIAAGTSTGGTPFAPRGRVGDSPFPGCGVWADDNDGCASCTGYGESILVEMLAAKSAQRVTKMPAMIAAREAIRAFAKTPRSVAGVIMIAKATGEYGLFHNTVHMPFAFLNEDGTITSGLSVGELGEQ
ncbi:Family T2, asparaginase-like threonine peptidase [Tritrichomonas foetus]|uniref:beta-aspartyl-peptidase n=1 Tax=Tritrichomonas foetus TaxID=1144522 RepID=A0A1J4JS58_9EUKA|nr:Family T2, asparaginase-like threonine peptidase [Tritrichomonas foetus]|eukprot:OHT01945.1 Family T2, asparaginase-like threonine peptidase [Tritrichomonas foetus]